MTMNQLIHLCQIYVGAKDEPAFCQPTFRDDLVLLIKKGLVENSSKGTKMVPSAYMLTDKGTYTCARILDFAQEGANSEYNGNPMPDEDDGPEDEQDRTNWEYEADQAIGMVGKLYSALQGILEIGKRNMSNPKYDGHFDTAEEACQQARRFLKLSDEV